MKTSIEKIRALSQEEFEKLINYIDIEKLRKLTVDNAMEFPQDSKYYLSLAGKGVFWSGNSMPDDKFRQFYTSVIYLKKDVRLEPDFFIEFLDEYTGSDENYKTNKTIWKIYTKLFDDIDSSDNYIDDNALELDEDVKEDNSKQLEELKNEYENKIKELNELLSKKNKEIDRLNKELKDKDKSMEVKYINKRASIISKVSSMNYANGLTKIIETNKLKSNSDIKKYLDECLVKNSELSKNNDFSKLSDALTYEYLLSSLLEE